MQGGKQDKLFPVGHSLTGWSSTKTFSSAKMLSY